MKKYLYTILILSGIIAFSSCSDDDDKTGNPVLTPKTQFGNAMFGDSLSFTLGVADADVPLSTVKAQLYFDEEKVSETVIRTKTNGEYSGKLYIPYYKDIPNGTATLKFVLQNINFTITEQVYDLAVSRPDYPYLTLVTEDAEYQMKKVGLYQYELKANLPQQVKGYIKTPIISDSGNELTFGWKDDSVDLGSTENISFSNSVAGEYAITFNTSTYEASPFIIAYTINNEVMQRIDDGNFKIDLNLTQGSEVTIGGIDGVESWWIDPDYFKKDADGKLTFVPITGNYRITANFTNEYFIVEALKNGDTATLQADGTGALWIIGDGVGKPSIASNTVGWDTSKALCMAPIGNKKYQMTLEAGKTVKVNEINFKFFHQKGWGGEFKNDALTTTSDIIFVGDGANGRDAGNLGIVEGKTLETGTNYVFVVDLSNGNDKAVLTVTKK